MTVSLMLLKHHKISHLKTLMEATPDSTPNSRSFALIAGQFYNSNESDGQSGEIAFEIMIGNRGNGGLEAFWEASRVMENDPSDFEQIASGTLIGPGTLDTGVPYLVKVVYNNDRTLTVTVNGVTDEYTGPEKKRPAVNPARSIGASIDAADGSNDGFIHATFDNVVFNNAAEIHGDFSSPLIDLSKWDQTEWVRECSSGYLRANVRRIGGSPNASTYFTTEKNTPYLEAKVRIESDTRLSPGAYGIARLGGYYYNETRGPGSGVDYNRYEGDVFAQIRLTYDSDGNTQAQVWVGRSDDADENNFTELFWHTFSTHVELDTYYVLSISYENNQIIFQCEDEQAVFNIQTETYPPYGIHRQLRTWLRAGTGESGYFKASYDDIYFCLVPVWSGMLDSFDAMKIISGQSAGYSSGQFFGSYLLLPAAGYRYNLSGTLGNRGGNGYYWSSSGYGRYYAWRLYFLSSHANTYYFNRRYGHSVRYVAE